MIVLAALTLSLAADDPPLPQVVDTPASAVVDTPSAVVNDDGNAVVPAPPQVVDAPARVVGEGAAPPAPAAAPAPAATTTTEPSLWSPTPMEKRRPLVTDRPDLTESPITVDAGHLQIESDLVVVTARQTGTSIDLLPTNMKVGLSSSIDLQVLVPSLGIALADDGTATSSGGDAGLRLKVNLLGNDDGDVAVAVMPWVFLGGGDLRPGGGVIVPVSFALPWDFALGTMVVGNYVPVADDGYDVEGVVSASVSHAIVGSLAGYLEGLATGRPLTVDGEVIASAGLTLGLGDSLQLDAGARLPVVTADPRVEAFVGLSARH